MTKISPEYTSRPYIPAGPNAMCCATVRDFIVVATEADKYTIQWSAIFDPTDWPTPNTDDARAKQAGSQTLNPHYGWVTGIAGSDFYGYVFQERAITKMSYLGGDVVFAFDTFETDRGCIRVGQMVQIDDMVIFQSDRGKHLLLDGQIQDISLGILES